MHLHSGGFTYLLPLAFIAAWFAYKCADLLLALVDLPLTSHTLHAGSTRRRTSKFSLTPRASRRRTRRPVLGAPFCRFLSHLSFAVVSL